MAIKLTKHTDGNYILNIPSRYDGELNINLGPRAPQNPQKLASYYRRYWKLFLKFRKACFSIYFTNSYSGIDLRNKKNRWIETIFEEGMEKSFWREWRTK